LRRKVWQRVWEMQIGSHLLHLGYEVSSPVHGPDFRFKAGDLTVWVEAVSPAPRGIPLEWFAFPAEGVGTTYETPNDQMLLRWTHAFKTKRAKFEKYAPVGITAPSEACVIAINGSQLSGFWQDSNGVSLLPWPVEVVFPVGPVEAVFLPENPT
jgi:hypothetical protein